MQPSHLFILPQYDIPGNFVDPPLPFAKLADCRMQIRLSRLSGGVFLIVQQACISLCSFVNTLFHGLDHFQFGEDIDQGLIGRLPRTLLLLLLQTLLSLIAFP